ncbi:MAG: hypothetical protein Q8P44_07210 [Dehalococcoidia bacterium]|nr:hypothetical protein [Dehalococcoidia bacterium]
MNPVNVNPAKANRGENHRLFARLLIVWMVILSLAIFAHAQNSSQQPLSLSVLPEVPREGEPMLISFTLNNPGSGAEEAAYTLFINGEKVKIGRTLLSPFSSKNYSYIYINDQKLGGQARFYVTSSTSRGSYDQNVSLPAYPPQVWSSFVSFASFSTSVMGMGSMGSMGSSMSSSISTMVYYNDNFTSNAGVQVGLIFALVLVLLLVFKEVSAPVCYNKYRFSLIVPLRLRFRTVTMILLIIFLGMVFSRVVMLLTL